MFKTSINKLFIVPLILLLLLSFISIPCHTVNAQDEVTIVIQPDDITGKDSYVYEYDYQNWPAANFGREWDLRAGRQGDYSAGGRQRSYLQFDISTVPTGMEIVNATLNLYEFHSYNPNPASYAIYRVTGTWNEGTGQGKDNYLYGVLPTAPPGDISWNQQPSHDAGVAYGTNSINPLPTYKWISFTITDLVKNWHNGTWQNYGMVLRLVDENQDSQLLIWSAEVTPGWYPPENATFRPKLSITYKPIAIPLPTINSFTANPASIIIGSSSMLSWSVSGATSVFIDQGIGIVSASGNSVVSPSATATYTLIATNSTGTVINTVTIAVTPLQEATQNLVTDIQTTPDLPVSVQGSLVPKLDAAVKALNNDQPKTAVNQLNAFINQIEAQRGKKITDAQANDLIGKAQKIINNIK